MSAILLIAFLTVTAFVWELIPLFKKGFIKDAMLYLVILMVGVYLSSCTILLFDLPSPMALLNIIFKPLLKGFAP
ncbi:hypothetical protein [Paenibacillus luteus]|uniref:hypothetical protein n=1 Tax=Paenibacillus luteus TaxID=2545753 RepID=UPI00114411FF|nr:hypothetical protein [Paenibacillus luteus]